MELKLDLKSILKIANPIMLGGFVQFILTFVDTAFLGHIGELELNAAGNAGLIYITLFLVAQGLSEGLQILTARRLGQDNSGALKNLFWNALFILILVSIFSYVVVGLCNSYYISAIIADPELSTAMEGFLSIRSFGYFFSVSQLALIGFYTGIAQTKILAYSTTILAVVNLLFDYLLIYGIGIFPEMGLNGAALASVIAEVCVLLFSVWYIQRDKNAMNWIGFEGFRIVKAEIKSLIALGAPIMGQRFLAMISWTIFFFFIEKLGTHDLAISQILRSLYFLAFIPIMGFGTTTKTYVSHFMAKKQFPLVTKSIRKLSTISLITLIILSHGFLLYPEAIIRIITNDAALIKDTAPILQLVFFQAQIFMVASVVFNAVAGVGATKVAFYIENACIGIYILGAYLLTIVYPQDIFVVWCLEFVYFTTLLSMSWLYFKTQPWQKIDI